MVIIQQECQPQKDVEVHENVSYQCSYTNNVTLLTSAYKQGKDMTLCAHKERIETVVCPAYETTTTYPNKL